MRVKCREKRSASLPHSNTELSHYIVQQTVRKRHIFLEIEETIHHRVSPHLLKIIRSRSSSRSRSRGGSGSNFLLFLRSPSTTATSTTTTYPSAPSATPTSCLWRRGERSVLVHLDSVLHLSFVVSLRVTPPRCDHLLVLDGHIDVQRLSLLERVVLLLAVLLVLRLVQVLLVLLKSDLEVKSLGTLLETNTDVSLLAVLLDSHHEITRRIQHWLDHLHQSAQFPSPTEGPSSRIMVEANTFLLSSMSST